MKVFLMIWNGCFFITFSYFALTDLDDFVRSIERQPLTILVVLSFTLLPILNVLYLRERRIDEEGLVSLWIRAKKADLRKKANSE